MPNYPGRRQGTRRVTIFHNGRQQEWIVEGKKKDADRFEENKRIELRTQSVALARGEPTFYDFCRLHYGPHAALHLGARTWAVRRYQIDDFCTAFGDRRLSKVGDEIESYKARRIESGLEASTVNHALNVLRAMLRWAKEQGMLDVVPKFRKLPEDGDRRVHWWTRQQVRELFEAAQRKFAFMVPLLHFLLDSGVRKGEAVAAEWSWIDWDAKMLRIPVTKWWRPKSKRPREIPLSGPLFKTLRALKAQRPDAQATDKVFLTPFDRLPYARFPNATFAKVVAGAKLTGSPHTTRHTFASHFLAARPDLGLLAEVLGHSQLRVTELYSHMLPERLARARDVVNLGPASEEWVPTVVEANG